MNSLIVIVLLVLSALFSGMTLGLLSLSPYELKRKKSLGDRDARRVYPIRQTGNQLLVTLLVGNVLVNSIFSIFLDSFLQSFFAILLSTILITVFGDILPQAFFARNGLKYGAKLAPVIERVLWLFSPVAKPMAWVLDRLLGDEVATIYSKDELVKIVEEHSISADSDVAEDELRIVENVLNFGDMQIDQVMTPRSVIVGIEEGEILSPERLNELHASGHSRFPVYAVDLDHVVGVLYLRDLVKLKGTKRAKDAMDSEAVYFVNESEKLDHVLNAFVKTKKHMYMAVNGFKEVVGLITIEDVIEEILGQEIVDEFDKYDDMREVAEHNAA